MSGPGSILSSVPLFANLPSDVLDELAGASRVRQYPQGQILCNEGDPGDDLIVLESGLLRISRYMADGNEAVLAVYDAPAAIGELALLDGAPRDAAVTAQRKVTVRLIPRSVFMDLLGREPEAVRGLLATLAGMVRAANARHADLIGLDVPGRLAKWLLRQADGARDVRIGRSQGELAAELGTTRSTLNRALHDFESLGHVALDGTTVTLLNPDALRMYTS
jgi:CRP/FNR family transcriptional regulator, cyclic AMP receptor protein